MGFISIGLVLLDAENPLEFPRHSSCAGLLHLPMFAVFCDLKYLNFPRRASRAELLHLPGFCCFWVPNTPNSSRRALCAGLLHLPVLLLLEPPPS